MSALGLSQSIFLIGTFMLGQAELKTFDPMSISDMDALARKLRPHVAHVTAVEKVPKGHPVAPKIQDGFAIVIDSHHVAMLSVILKDAEKIMINGPSGQPTPAKVVALETEKRVAILRSDTPLERQGLLPASPSPANDWKEGQAAFALLGTIGEPAVMDMQLTHLGTEDGFEGTPRLDRQLKHGMPVFDAQARFMGYSRAILWDWDKQLIVPQPTIEAVFAKEQKKPKADKPKAKR